MTMMTCNTKYLLALLVLFLLHAVVVWPLAAATIESTGDVSPTPGASPWNAKGELYVGYTRTGELHIADGGTVSSSGTNVLGYWEGSSGTVTVDGKGSTWTTTGNSSSSFFAVGLLGDGSMTITNGGAVYCEGLGPGYYYNHSYVGSEAGTTGIVLVDGEGSTWGNSGNLYVGNVGNGTLTITNGGTVYNHHGIVGQFYTDFGDGVIAHGVGVVTVDGAGSTWTNNGALTVGSTGEGTVNIINGGAVFSNNGNIGNQVSSLTGLRGQGLVTVDGKGSTWTNSNTLTIGTSGDGALIITNGGAVSNTDGHIAKNNDSTGVVWVDGKDSTWINSGTLTVGKLGDGTLTITDGGAVSNTHGTIAEWWGSTGLVNVSGTDAKWTNTGYLAVGEGGTGALNIASGGTVSNTTGYIGYDYDAVGGVLVDGPDSTWENSGSLYVGTYGSGELAVTNGGKVSSISGVISYDAGAGTVTVDGVGSTWTNTDYLFVGYGGAGELTIRNGSVVTADNATIIASQADSMGVLNIGASAGDAASAPGTFDAPTVMFGDGFGRIVFNHTDTSGDYTFASVIHGGAADHSAVNVYSGTTVLTGVGSDYTGAAILYGGTLAAGAENVFSRNSDYVIDVPGTMDLRGHSQHTGSLTNAGLITMGTDTAPGTTLTVHGDYVGVGGTIVMNTKLGDDASPTDRLIIDGGNASGSTFLDIVNAKGLGAQTQGNGILLVGTDNGGTTDLDAFALKNQVKAGAFEYTLYRGGVDDDADSDDWFLRSGGGVRSEVPGIVVVPALAPQMGRVMVGTLFTRTGNYYGYGMGRDNVAWQTGTQPETQPARRSKHDDMLWGRVFGETGRNGGGSGNGNFGFGRNGPAYTFTYTGTQLGVDLFRGEKDILGLYLGYSNLHSRVKDVVGDFAGNVDMDTLNFAGYWTHYDPSGWYTDLVLQGDWYADIRSHSAHGEKFSTYGWGLTASAETGYAIEFGEGNKKWSMIPQAQVIYQYTDIQDGSDQFGRIHYGATNAFYGRVGDRVSKTWSSGVSTWAEANLWHQFGSDAQTTFRALDGSNPTVVSARMGGTWAQAVLGVSVPLTKNVSLFGTVDYNIGISQSSQSVGGQVGIQISW
ncbi:MAG: autotransporter outer membrane beta-barrel domain-containing protein [Phycisphaerae bacterium]|nr:autotransporter outer membrane beta-barrel domain-containing protein [Phycisphaerae bacterium]